MKRTPEQAAKVAAWLNMMDHCEAQLQALGALPEGRDALREAREQVATLSQNLETVIQANAARKARAVTRGRKSREALARLDRVVARLAEANHRIAELATANASLADRDEERRLELLAIAQELGCDCVPHKMIEAVKALQGAARKVKR